MKAAMPRQVAIGVYRLGLGGVNVFFLEDWAGPRRQYRLSC